MSGTQKRLVTTGRSAPTRLRGLSGPRRGSDHRRRARSAYRVAGHRNWRPPFGGGTHSALPLPDRGLLIEANEAVLEDCADGTKYDWVFDVREKRNPISIATFPVPSDRDYCKAAENLVHTTCHTLPHLPRWHTDRMVVIGDAAHAPSPTSQGGSLSIRMRCNSPGACATNVEPCFGLRAFEQSRRPRVERIIKAAARINSSKAATGFSRVMRDLMLPLILRLEPARRRRRSWTAIASNGARREQATARLPAQPRPLAAGVCRGRRRPSQRPSVALGRLSMSKPSWSR